MGICVENQLLGTLPYPWWVPGVPWGNSRLVDLDARTLYCCGITWFSQDSKLTFRYFLWSGSILTPQGNFVIIVIDHVARFYFCYQVTAFLMSSLKDDPIIACYAQDDPVQSFEIKSLKYIHLSHDWICSTQALVEWASIQHSGHLLPIISRPRNVFFRTFS